MIDTAVVVILFNKIKGLQKGEGVKVSLIFKGFLKSRPHLFVGKFEMMNSFA